MAIGSFTLDYLLSIAQIFEKRRNQAVLELGESEVVFFELASHLDRIHEVCGYPRDRLEVELAEARQLASPRVTFSEAQLIYKWLLNMTSYRAIDLSSTAAESWIDLNNPSDLGQRFDTVINNGTSEHVFNQANVFRFIHDHTKLGGLMIHYTTGLGWIDHGFYNLQPSFFFDLAKYNGYEVLSCCLVNNETTVPLKLGGYEGNVLRADPRLADALIHCCMRRCDSAAFRYPIQRPYQPSH